MHVCDGRQRRGHVVETIPNWSAAGPESDGAGVPLATFPTFVTVKVVGAESVPTGWLPKSLPRA